MEFSIGSVPGRPIRARPPREQVRRFERPAPQGRLLSDAFDVLPGGILIVSDEGRVLTWNPALADLVGDGVESATTCCDVLGCGRPGTPLEDICLTQLSLARRSPLPETVIEVSGDPGQRVAVTATRFNRGKLQRVLFELRAVGQRPPNRSPRAAGALHIRALGETVLETAAGDIHGDWLDQRPGRLLKFLIAHRYRPMHADTIAEALWPRSRADTTNTVRHFVHLLRERLEPDRRRYQRSRFVLARNGGYLLNPECVSVDADDFEHEARAGLIALAANERRSAVEHLERALELYTGDFLSDERFDDWAIAERERLRDLATKPLRILATLTTDQEAAAGYVERLAEMEPLDVEIHRELISLWLHLGRRGRAIRHYRALQSRLMRELGERVTFDLAELARTTTYDGQRAASS